MANVDATLIQRIVRNGLCTGCGLCQSIAAPGGIEIRLSSEGYLRPFQKAPLTAEQERVLADACPGVRIEPVSQPRKTHAIWGPLVGVRAGHASDSEMRQQGSSGGAISALTAWMIESGRVDYVAQIAVSQDDPLRNDLQVSSSRAEVLRAAGSRYSPSAPLANLRELLNRGQRFAFVGKPCDVAALRRYATHDPRVNAQVVCMISFMCAGIPSLHGTHKLLERLGVDRNQLKSFRYRGDGWPGMARAVQQDGKVFETDYSTSWGAVLNKHLQFRCKICPDGTGEFADLVCADAWYGADGYPDFAERQGRSLILSRSASGESLVLQAISAGVLQADRLPVAEIESMQPYQAHRKRMVLGRLGATWLAGKLIPRFRSMNLLRASAQANKVQWLRDAVGTFRRAKGEVP